MRLVPAIILLATGALVCAGQAEAKAYHRARARAAVRVVAPPSHGMSALARQQARERARRDLQRGPVLADERPEIRFGGFKRDYSLDVQRPIVRPDQDGAVGLSIRMKTRH